ncbi:MAG TPA: DUF58 domain-containing protein [Acidimicrobiales bacterium]|jgi:uncharacterized protein (DUF58 family)|nr:DUF58 domain-containing protein [Acidimicrobiales bacterium]
MTRWARPTRPLAPIGASIGILAIWWLVAHNGGAGWVQLLGDLVFGALLIGLVGPFFVLLRARVTLLVSPSDGTAGLPLELHIRVSTRVRVRMTEPQEIEVLVGPRERRAGTSDTITVVPTRRGVYETLTLDIASAAPFALQWWRRPVELRLPVALHIAPRRGRPVSVRDAPSDDLGERRHRRRVESGSFRGVAPYRAGDNRRLVHWPATAHVGQLMVRELERPTSSAVSVHVALPADPEEAERVAERALGTVAHFLELGAHVVLDTMEERGPVSAVVADRRSAGRRLASAVARSGSGSGPGRSAAPGIAVTP